MFTLVEMGYVFAVCGLQTMRLSPGVNSALTHMNFLLSVDDFLFDVTSQSVSKTVHDTLLEIPS